MAAHLLLVEDDAPLAEMLNEYLGSAGFVVTHAATGAGALQQLARTDFDALVST